MITSSLAELRLRQVVPLPTTLAPILQQGYDPVPTGQQEIEWPMLAGREWQWRRKDFEIEPGEMDSLHADFAVGPGVDVVQFYFFLANPTKRRSGLGWSLTRFEDLTTTEGDAMSREEAPKDRSRLTPLQGQREKQQVPQQRQQPQQQQQSQEQAKPEQSKK